MNRAKAAANLNTRKRGSFTWSDYMLRALIVLYLVSCLLLALIDGRLHKRLKRDATRPDGWDRAAEREERWYGSPWVKGRGRH